MGWILSSQRREDFAERLAALERRQKATTDFLIRAYWDSLDRLYDRVPTLGCQSCLACASVAPTSSYARKVDQCIFGGGRLERLVCAECGCVFGPLKYLEAPPELIELDYRQLYAAYAETDSTQAEIRAFHALNPVKGGLYLNWGSGAWSLAVQKLRDEGYDVWGYEPHAETDDAFIVKSRSEIGARFDGIFSNNVLEHLLDPAAQFADFGQILRPGGRMAHATACYQWLYAFTRFHVFFPLGSAPERLAARTGFRVVGHEEDGEFQLRIFEKDPE